jgi:hypothetical protein
VDEHDGRAPLQLVEQRTVQRLAQVVARGVGEQHDPVEEQFVQRAGQFGKCGVDVGQDGEPAEAVGA